MFLARSYIQPRSDAEERVHFGAEDVGWQALGPAIACVWLATCAVAARWFSRLHLARCVGLEDYVIVLALVRIAQRFTQRPGHVLTELLDLLLGDDSLDSNGDE